MTEFDWKTVSASVVVDTDATGAKGYNAGDVAAMVSGWQEKDRQNTLTALRAYLYAQDEITERE